MDAKLCKFVIERSEPRIGATIDGRTVLDLGHLGVTCLGKVLEDDDPAGVLEELTHANPPRIPLPELRLCPPVDAQEVWAAGVTYLRSKTARMEESEFSANAYDRVYGAERPELFFKALAKKVVGPEEEVGIRQDARWSVPEPELALVFNSKARLVGYTIGNDMSSRDIEGENLLYLPQAKTYNRSCSLGPWIRVGVPEAEAREWKIHLTIRRQGDVTFAGATAVDQIKRGFDELGRFLFRCQTFSEGAVLLTGTGIVPPDHFTLQPEDMVEIEISGIGSLQNRVRVV